MDSLHGTPFQLEINKFKFLNELVNFIYIYRASRDLLVIIDYILQIRLVSKKFLGDKTPKEIQDRVGENMTKIN